MIGFTTYEIADLLCGRMVGDDVAFHRVSSDSRNMPNDALFVAIPGERFDGHDYLQQAVDAGAVAALVNRHVDVAIPQVVVEDVLYAFGELATAWRQKSSARVIALTGSNGKTTVKEMLAAILARKGSVLATIGNLNNDIGVPLTLTRLQDEQYAVIEMGANHASEIRYLTRLTRPDVALLNNAGRAHLEGFGSLEGVARAKAEIIEGLASDGVFVCHGDSEWLTMWRALAGARPVVTFGTGIDCDVRLLEDSIAYRWDDEGFRQQFDCIVEGRKQSVGIALAGRHNCLNAVAAIAVADQVDVDAEAACAALAGLEPVKGRLQPIQTDRFRLLDDTYNANPDSVTAAIQLLSELPGRAVLVLGDLGELGPDSDALHASLGDIAREGGVDRLFTLGAASAHAARHFGSGGYVASTFEELMAQLDAQLETGDTVLIKGSRSAHMERVVNALVNEERVSC